MTFHRLFAGLLLDLKMAVRMLARYPLLTIVGSAGMAFGIAAGVGGFEIRTQFVNPRLPLEDGSRIVGLRNRDIRGDRPGQVSHADFAAWREQLRTIQDLGAVVLAERNLTVERDVEPVAVAEMSASGFKMARVPPMRGRTLLETDESPGALAVAVIGHALWQRRFHADARIVGSVVRLGADETTIVGVMPEGFRFPLAHDVWIPLRRPAQAITTESASLLVFGRLASGVETTEAQAELTTIAGRLAAEAPATHEFLRPEVVPYAHLVSDPSDLGAGLTLANIFLVTLVLVVCGNVALLMFARAASREREFGVRAALGASRSRIVTQLFVEAALLSGISVAVGLGAARFVLGSLLRTLEADAGRPLPFWMSETLTPSTVAYGVGLTLAGAVITGVFPALRVTGRHLEARLRRHSSGGGGYRFGGVWTAVIAAQVAVTVMFPAAAFFFHRWVVDAQARDPGVPAEQYVSARLFTDGGRRSTADLEELRRQLLEQPGVTSVTFADRLPGMQHPAARFEVEGDDAPPERGYDVRMAAVDTSFFEAMQAPVLAGRGFTAADLASGRDVVIVNASFVERVLGGRNPVGRRIRRASPGADRPPGPWVEVIGVTRDLGVAGANGVGVYLRLEPGSPALHLAMQVRGPQDATAARLRTIANGVSPTLRVHDVMPLNKVGADQWLESQYLSRVLAVLSGLALLLSLMAIYAVMAFTVVQRTREIGTRVALGADSRRVVAAIVRRPLIQIGLGIAAGVALVVFFYVAMFNSTPALFETGTIAAYAGLMLAVCLSACVVPLRRALRLEPGQVLRSDI